MHFMEKIDERKGKGKNIIEKIQIEGNEYKVSNYRSNYNL